MDMEVVYSWVGFAVVWSVGGAAVVAFIAGIYGVLYLAFEIYARKVFNGVKNWHAVHAWDKAGRPTWQWDGPKASMKPTVAA